jgi:hypothetical protein
MYAAETSLRRAFIFGHDKELILSHPLVSWLSAGSARKLSSPAMNDLKPVLVEEERTMSSMIKVSLAAILATAAMTGISYAAMSAPDKALATDHNPRFVISTPGEIEKHDTFQDFLGSLSPTSPQAREVQAAIRENPALCQQFRAQHIELKNVIYADQASDGSFVIYVH